MDRDRASTRRSRSPTSSRTETSPRADGAGFHSLPRCHTCGAVLERRDRYCPQCGTGQGSARGRLRRKLRGVTRRGKDVLYGMLGWTLVLLALPAVAIALGAALEGALAVALVAIAWALLLVGAGLLVNPRFGRQLSRRHSLPTVGRVRSVDHRVVSERGGPVEPCTNCGERFGVGVVRRRRDEFVLAGLPIYTFDLGYTHYCADCEETGRFGTLDAGDPDSGKGAGVRESASRADSGALRRDDGVAAPADEPAGLLEAARDAAIEAGREAAIAAGQRAARGVARRVGTESHSGDDRGRAQPERDGRAPESDAEQPAQTAANGTTDAGSQAATGSPERSDRGDDLAVEDAS